MDEKKFYKLIKKNKFQVFLFSSPVPKPLDFAVHTWFVININGKIERWEFGMFQDSPHPKGIGILKNFLMPTKGMKKYFWKRNLRFKSKIISYIEGDKNSIAEKLCLYIHKNSNKYPLKQKYSYFGPNSNTYTSWIINKFPKSKFKLPWNAFGKKYRIR